MLSFGKVNENGVLDVTVSGRLTHDDYARAVPKLEDLLAEHGRLRFLVTIESLDGIEAEAVWDDLRFGVKHGRQFDRTAIVGHGALQKWMTLISNMFFAAEIRFFEHAEAEEAARWVNA